MLRALPSDPQLPVNDPMRPVGNVRRWVDHLAGNHQLAGGTIVRAAAIGMPSLPLIPCMLVELEEILRTC